MADFADLGSDSAQLFLEQSLANRRQPPAVVTTGTCADCDAEIPAQRLAALASRGCVRCVECQGYCEREEGNGRG
jgi:phage/conjugal plasmid C-4 type zinc finger TraR family protein